MTDEREALIERGREASRFVAALRARKAGQPESRQFPHKVDRVSEDDWDAVRLAANGYWRFMYQMELQALDDARRYIAESRPRWRREFMRMVETMLKFETDPTLVRLLKLELRKVRRALGLNKPSADTVREQTRLRVRQYRERAKRPASER
jgi:hypothetical protein